MLIGGFLMVTLFKEVVTGMRAWVVIYLASTINVQWLSNVFSHLLKLPLQFFERRHLGDIVSRFESISTIQRSLTTSFIEAIIDGAMTVITLAMMMYYSAKLGGLMLVTVIVYALLRTYFYSPMRQTNFEYILADAKQRGHFLETLRGVCSLKLSNRQDDRTTRYLNLLVESTNQSIRMQRFTLAMRAANQTLFGVVSVIVMWIGARDVIDRQFSVGMLFAFLAYKDQFTQRIVSLIDKLVELRMLRLHGDRLADIVLASSEDEGEAVGECDHLVPSLDVKDLVLKYSDTEAPVLNGVTFSVNPGESVAIVGVSGSGKTSLLKILLGLVPPNAGDVRVGGKTLRSIGLRNYRQVIGVVMQDDQLFAGSIAENICFFDNSPKQEWIEECARLAAIHDDIENMPMGYNTLIGDMGAAISGGQKQRILLARALYRKPKILFLDEATSALDVKGEKLVNAAVARLSLTRIIIAHRPETINSADRVLVLENGRIAQDFRQIRNSRAGMGCEPEGGDSVGQRDAPKESEG
jgi:ATP-binding cassette subfamily B protein RaxB